MAKRILVLGGGFAGLAAVDVLSRRRADISIQLIDRGADSAFAPILPDLISQRISAEHALYPLAPYCARRGVEFIRADVESIDLAQTMVHTSRGGFSGDYLILCLGCENNYFGREDMKRHAFGLKSVAEAERIRAEAERMLRDHGGTAAGASFIIVGGGYTGFEIAGHLARHLDNLRQSGQEKYRICILEVAPQALANVGDEVRARAIAAATGMGIEIITGVTLEEFSPDSRRAKLNNGATFDNAMIIWSTGVTPGAACAGLATPKLRGGRLAVDDCLRLPEHPNVFAAGDVAGAHAPGAEIPLRLAVQFAITGGRHAAHNVLRAIRGEAPTAFNPRDLGYLLPLPGAAAGVVLGRRLGGRLPYLLHYMLCIYRSRGGNRMGILRDLLF